MSLGKNLRCLIEERNITQKELAENLNIAPSTISSYVQGAREPDFVTLKLLARYFNVTTDYLLDNYTDKAADYEENELLRIFRSLYPEQRHICIEQCRVFLQINNNEKEKTKKSS